MNEWEFTGDVNSWINEILDHIPIPPFHRSKVEQTGTAGRKRRDLSILDKSKRVVLTGEVKLPYQADGNSPYVTKVVDDARKKARRAKARFFFTWNVNECVLWETDPADASRLGQDYRSWQVTNVHNERQLEHRATEDSIQDWLVRFLHEVSRIVTGTIEIGRKPPDEKFIDALESALRMPIQFTYNELERRHHNKRERAHLEKWMREEQGWTILDGPEGIRENLERASKFACYALVNRLVFHEALLKRYGEQIEKLRVPDHIDTGEDLWIHLEGYFKDAISITGDYETVFGEKHRSVGNLIPFHSDEAVPHWRALVEQIHDFDFSRLDHEVVGSLFERLISPEERHKYGQYYTKVEIVDLINSFCIRRGDEKIMDPACGGGTFLVRAYGRMKTLMPRQSHGAILKNIFGVDIMNFATHLSTINLVVRDLINDENYPQIVRSDFFDVDVDKVFATLPRKAKANELGSALHRDVRIPQLDAVIGNPPYIRQEEIPKAKKPVYADIAKREAGLSLSGRSDIHCYFWPHAAKFLKEDGYLCLLTSSQWLDVEYGFKLQEWILRNFEIQAVFESIEEPWFVGARVATTVTILRRQHDEASRMANDVRFVQLRRPISVILSSDGTIAGAMGAAEDFRDEILSLQENTVNMRYRARLVKQKHLCDTGIELGKLMGATDGGYFGGKWGVHLRAPDLWFQLQEAKQGMWTPLSQIASIHRGITSGNDGFFFPRDCSSDCLTKYPDTAEFASNFGVPRQQVASGKVKLVLCGEGYSTVKPIEAAYLEPELHSLMEVDGFVALPENCARMILLVGERRKKIKGKYAAAYVKWGESLGIHKSSTCAARQTESREWYDLTGHKRGSIFWPMTQKYKHAVPFNRHGLICNHNLFDLTPKDGNAELLAAILNSSLVALSKFQFGRFAGTEGTLKTEVVDVNMMLVPNTSVARPADCARVLSAFQKMLDRKVLQFLSEKHLRQAAYLERGLDKELEELSDISELDMPDRRALDDAVLHMLGIRGEIKRGKILDRLYADLKELFARHRDIEEKANLNKRISARRGRFNPADVAAQIFDEIQVSDKWMLQRYGLDFLNRKEPFDSFDIPDEGTPQQSSDMFQGSGLTFVKGKKQNNGHIKTQFKDQDDLIVFLVNEGYRTIIRIPHIKDECKRVMREYTAFVQKRDAKLRELVADRTADEDLQEKILVALKALLPK